MHQALLRSCCLLFCLLSAGHLQAQHNSGAPWKNLVTRMIDMREAEDTRVHHLKSAGTDTSLAEMIIKAARKNKIAAYSNVDVNFSTRLSVADINDMLISKPDSMTLVDPVSGQEVTQIIKRDFSYDVIHKFRLLEEWTFNPATGKTDIQVTGFAPVKDVYGENGEFRGEQAIFWLHYADAAPIIARYDLAHPNKTFAGHVWDDYFLSDVKPKVSK